MKSASQNFLRLAFGILILASSSFGLGGCSSHETAKRQQSITDWHQSMLDQRETRQQARDERFRASREAALN
jgi:hypothetical protein